MLIHILTYCRRWVQDSEVSARLIMLASMFLVHHVVVPHALGYLLLRVFTRAASPVPRQCDEKETDTSGCMNCGMNNLYIKN